MKNAIEVRNLCKSYEGFALDRVSFSLPSGCIMGFVGENGAGKSTTIKALLGLIKRDSGEISVLGHDPQDMPPQLREEIGVVMDEASFPAGLTLRNVDAIMSRSYRTWDRERFRALSARLSLPEGKKFGEFSRGMKMKLSIAAALSHASRLLILDEATSGLDPIVRGEILDIFLDFIQDEGHSVFISSHIVSDLEKICDYVTLINRGRIIFSEEKDRLREEYVLVKCSAAELERIDPRFIVGSRRGSFGAEALVRREGAGGLVSDPAGIEDIMLYFVKESEK